MLYISDSAGAADLELQPGSPNVVFACMWHGQRKPWTIISGAREGGIYKSTDSGLHWTKLAGGLPNELFGRSNVAISAAAPNRIYALIEAKPGSGLYRSEDAGATWSLVNGAANLITRPFYYDTLGVDPNNADVVLIGDEGWFKSTDGGKSFRPSPAPHGDHHDVWINPKNSQFMIQSNDGGANVSLDGGRTWSTQLNQPTAEIYQVAVDDQYPYRVYGAQQDNTTVIVPSLPLGNGQDFRVGPGCETGPIIPDVKRPDLVYGSCKGQFTRLNLNTSNEERYWIGVQSLYGNPGGDLIYRFQRVSPMEVSPHDSRIVYYGSQFVHRTRDGGVTWEKISPDLTARPEGTQGASGEPITRDATGEEVYSTLYSIRESPLQKGLIWAGSNDGLIHVTRDDGKTWTNVTPKGLPPGGRVQNLEPGTHNPATAYAAIYRFLLGDFTPFIYRTDDFGKTWTLLTDGKNGIAADEPTRVVREDPDRAGLLYAGTEFGMYISFDNGAHWQSFQLNLPNTPGHRYQSGAPGSDPGHPGPLLLDSRQPDYAASVRHQRARLPRCSSSRVRPSARHPVEAAAAAPPSSIRNPAPPSTTTLPPRPPAISPWRSSTPRTPSSANSPARAPPLRRRPRSKRKPLPTRIAKAAEAVSAAAPRVSIRPPACTASPGTCATPAHGPVPPVPNRPTVPPPCPAATSSRLTVGTWNGTQPFTLIEDPRITGTGVTIEDLREQFDHNIKVRDLVSDVNRTVSRVRAGLTELAGKPDSAATLASLKDLAASLITPPIRYSKPELQTHITYLYSETNATDQKVGRDAIERYNALRKELDQRIAQLDKLLK